MSARVVLLDDPDLPSEPAHDVALAPVLLRDRLGGADELVRVHHPAPTAAFSRRDTLRPGAAAAAAAARGLGFSPVVRPQGGRLAAYHRGSVVVDHVAWTADPHAGLQDRFREYAAAHAAALARLGADVRVGEVAGEYCPGAFSLNVAGTRKVAGAAQRVTRDGWVLSTVVQVTGAGVLRDVLAAAYAELGYPFEPATVGALGEVAPVSPGEVAAALLAVYADRRALRVVRLPPRTRAAVETEASTRRLGGG